MKAMQALDMASIMGAPAEMLAPVLHSTQPLAQQAHQANLTKQDKPSYQPAQKAAQQGDSASHSEQAPEQQSVHQSLGHLSSAVPEGLPTMEPGKMISRESAVDLTAAKFKKLYWKTDTPVIITGEPLATAEE